MKYLPNIRFRQTWCYFYFQLMKINNNVSVFCYDLPSCLVEKDRESFKPQNGSSFSSFSLFNDDRNLYIISSHTSAVNSTFTAENWPSFLSRNTIINPFHCLIWLVELQIIALLPLISGNVMVSLGAVSGHLCLMGGCHNKSRMIK